MIKVRGKGKVQRAIVKLFKEQPDARLTVRELAARIYPGRDFIGVSQTNATGVALRQLAPTLGLTRCRAFNERGGWHYVWGLK
jgi:hypothetical protein